MASVMYLPCLAEPTATPTLAETTLSMSATTAGVFVSSRAVLVVSNPEPAI